MKSDPFPSTDPDVASPKPRQVSADLLKARELPCGIGVSRRRRFSRRRIVQMPATPAAGSSNDSLFGSLYDDCVVELKFFCGFSIAEIAARQNVSERTVQRQWEKARILLYRALNPAA